MPSEKRNQLLFLGLFTFFFLLLLIVIIWIIIIRSKNIKLTKEEEKKLSEETAILEEPKVKPVPLSSETADVLASPLPSPAVVSKDSEQTLSSFKSPSSSRKVRFSALRYKRRVLNKRSEFAQKEITHWKVSQTLSSASAKIEVTINISSP